MGQLSFTCVRRSGDCHTPSAAPVPCPAALRQRHGDGHVFGAQSPARALDRPAWTSPAARPWVGRACTRSAPRPGRLRRCARGWGGAPARQRGRAQAVRGAGGRQAARDGVPERAAAEQRLRAPAGRVRAALGAAPQGACRHAGGGAAPCFGASARAQPAAAPGLP